MAAASSSNGAPSEAAPVVGKSTGTVGQQPEANERDESREPTVSEALLDDLAEDLADLWYGPADNAVR
jgi:hypothetical protein